MSTTTEELVSEIRSLPDAEKLRLLDAILTDLHKPDPELERVWAGEAAALGCLQSRPPYYCLL